MKTKNPFRGMYIAMLVASIFSLAAGVLSLIEGREVFGSVALTITSIVLMTVSIQVLTHFRNNH